jgi:ankyrin repeat protein
MAEETRAQVRDFRASFDCQEIASLLDAGAAINHQDEYGNTKLHDTVSYPRIDVCRLLLEKGANPNIKNHLGQTPLFSVLMMGHNQKLEITELLLSFGADPNDYEYRSPGSTHCPVYHSLSQYWQEPKEAEELAYLMLIHGSQIPLSPGGRSEHDLMHIACQLGSQRLVQEFLDHGMNPNQRHRSNHRYPIQIAFAGKHYPVVQLLLSHMDLSLLSKSMRAALRSAHNQGLFAIPDDLVFAIAIADHSSAKALLSESADITRALLGADQAIHLAARYGRRVLIRTCLKAGSNINAPGNGGNTPLHYAVKTGSTAAVKLLLDNGADPTKANQKGISPAMLSLSLSRPELFASI